MAPPRTLRRRRARRGVVGRVSFARRDAASAREHVLGNALQATLDGGHELEFAVAAGRARELERDAARGARRVRIHASVSDAPETRQGAGCASTGRSTSSRFSSRESLGDAHIWNVRSASDAASAASRRALVALARIDERPGLELQGQPAKGVARRDAHLPTAARATGRRRHRCDRARAARDPAARASRAPRCVSLLVWDSKKPERGFKKNTPEKWKNDWADELSFRTFFQRRR